MGNGVVARKVRSKEADRDVSLFLVRVVVRAHTILCARGFGRFYEGLVGRFYVEIAYALEPCIRDDRDRRVAFHRECLASEKLPFRHPSPFAVHAHHRPYHVCLPFRIDEGKKLVQVAVCVPERKYCIPVLALFDLAYTFALHQRIFAVDVVEDARMDKCMVQSGIEYFLVFF